MRILLLSMLLLFAAVAGAMAQDLTGLSLIAHYPLENDSADVTGLNDPIHLVNAPFQNGGVYINGIYIGSGDPNASDATTPTLDSLKFGHCAVKIQFRVDSLMNRPLFTVDLAWRALGAWLNPDGSISAIYNDMFGPNSQNVQYSANTWHTLTVVYDSITTTGRWYLDGTEFFNISFTIQHGGWKVVSVTHGGAGTTFKGILGDLKVYSEADVPTGIGRGAGLDPSTFSLEQNYPNPFNPVTNIGFRIADFGLVRLTVYDLLGREIKTLVDKEQPAGSYTVQWDGTNNAGQNVSSGVYLYKLEAGDFLQTRKMILMR